MYIVNTVFTCFGLALHGKTMHNIQNGWMHDTVGSGCQLLHLTSTHARYLKHDTVGSLSPQRDEEAVQYVWNMEQEPNQIIG
jgi:hypothetical protein